MLIGRRVIEAFTPEVVDVMGRPFECIHDGPKVKFREDLAFYWRLKELGIPVWSHSGIPLSHVKKHPVMAAHWQTAKNLIAQETGGNHK